MIRFQTRPDAVFSKILGSTLADIIQDCDANVRDNTDYFTWMSDDIIALFGGLRTVSGILKKLKAAHDSPDLWEISPYYYLLLDDILTTYAELYNDGFGMDEPEYLVHPSGREIKQINIDRILDLYFYDRDHLLEPRLAEFAKNNPEDFAQLGIEPEALNAARRMPPDLPDLWIRKSDNWWEEHEREEFDWFDEEVVEE